MPQARVTPEQRKKAIGTAVLLVVMALGIYLTVMLKFFVYR
jgi:hypothetical protein